MCGIAGFVGQYGSEDEIQLKRMLELINHRGPDESAVQRLPQVLLGHKRLSIIGPDDGIQPIPNEDGSVWIVCNGEIYNYKELKRKHLGGHRFCRNSDSEVILHLYEEFGRNCVDYLDGMFSFLIADLRGGAPKIFAARDPLGIKPLYYGRKDGKHYFSSELKCLHTIVDDLREFPPGHSFTFEDGFTAYRTADTLCGARADGRESPEEIMRNIRCLLEQSVHKRLMSDVPLGVLLSGGLDSSLISAIAARYNRGKAPIKSFCIGLEGSPDLPAAKDVADYIGSDHYEYVYTQQELLEAIPKVIYHLESFDPSLVRSAIPTYFVSKLAARHVKVILSGEGADELFGGYAYMKNINDEASLKAELARVLGSLHNINLQRMDRMSMAHSLEGRVPFLDEALVSYVSALPTELKMPRETENGLSEKWLLRKAFDSTGYLPDRILWRKKAEFSEGSGTKGFLDATFENCISDLELETESRRIQKEEKVRIRSKEELYFYRIFRTFYPTPAILNTIGHWAVA